MPVALLVGGVTAGALVFAVSNRRAVDAELELRADAVPDAADASKPDATKARATPESVGTPANGSLVDGARLPGSGPGFEVLAAHQGRGLVYGTDELLAVVTEVGAALAQDRRTLLVGNLSAAAGGPIRHSKSHQSGRDVDLAFCYQDGEGAPATPPDFVVLDKNVKARHLGLELDVPCTWRIVATAMSAERAEVQHIFVSLAVERALIRHARSQKTPDDDVEAAIRLLSQPRGSESHDDHMHVRVACPATSDACSDRTQFKGGHRFNEPPH
jgi:penicillin-insensitive murein DD-endopeptidase